MCVVTLNGDRRCSRHRLHEWLGFAILVHDRFRFALYLFVCTSNFSWVQCYFFFNPTYNPLKWSLYVRSREGFCEREHAQLNTGSACSPSLVIIDTSLFLPCFEHTSGNNIPLPIQVLSHSCCIIHVCTIFRAPFTNIALGELLCGCGTQSLWHSLA